MVQLNILPEIAVYEERLRTHRRALHKIPEVGYNELKTEMAVKFFIDNEKPKDVWLWLLETKKSDIEWDSVRRLKCIMKKELFN